MTHSFSTTHRLVGIDLGTTNSVIAVNGDAVDLALERGSAILPSVVAYPPSGAHLVGSPARRRRAIDAHNTIFSAKRLIGRPWHSPEVTEFARRYAFELIDTGTGPAFRTRAGDFTPTDVAEAVLKVLTGQTGAEAPAAIAVTVPTAFSPASRQATLDAARAAGAMHVSLIDEPVATAHAYLQRLTQPPGRVAVYDLGGGTFELAIVDCSRGGVDVIASGGDLYLGGDDIDLTIASWAGDEVLRECRWDLRDNPLVFDRLVIECERAKMRLCYSNVTHIELTQVDPAAPSHHTLTLERSRLEDLADYLVRRTFVLCDEVLARAGVRASEVSAVLLAGGTTQMPLVRRAVEGYFGIAPHSQFDPMEVVAIGASLAQHEGRR